MGLEITNITKRFGKLIAVDDLTLSVPRKEIFGFLGGNGAGKTTTFRMLLGLLDFNEGTITWNNENIDYNQSHLIGYLPEERGLYPKMTVKNQIIYLARLRGMMRRDSLPALKNWLQRFKIPEYLNKRVEELSKGNQQKIQFISAVIHKPELLILDEPFSGLDPVNVEMIKEAIVELKDAGTTIVFSSHQMSLVEELCEYLCILVQGKPVVKGSLRDIKQSFGKKNLLIQADYELDFLKDYPGVTDFKQQAGGCEFQIENEAVSQDIFHALQDRGFIRKFELREPTLNEIFIEKVGGSYE